ncbi:hypothetical protein EIN_131610, partial [Entamoeba invadens IP1]
MNKPFNSWCRYFTECIDLLQVVDFKTQSNQNEFKGFLTRLMCQCGVMQASKESVDALEICISGYCRHALQIYKNTHFPISVLEQLRDTLLKVAETKEFLGDVMVNLICSIRLFMTTKNFEDPSNQIEFQLYVFNLRKCVDNISTFLRTLLLVDSQRKCLLQDILKLILMLNEEFSTMSQTWDTKALNSRLTTLENSFVNEVQKVLNFDDYYISKMLFFHKLVVILENVVSKKTGELRPLAAEKIVLELQCCLQQAVNANNVLFVFRPDRICFSSSGNTLLSKHVTSLVEACSEFVNVLKNATTKANESNNNDKKAEEVTPSVIDGVENDKEKTVDLTSQILMQINR